MSYSSEGTPQCDGWCGDSTREPAYIDESGFIYCTECGPRRQDGWKRCRKMRAHEVSRIKRGQPVERY